MDQMNLSVEAYDTIVRGESLFFNQRPPIDCTHVAANAHGKTKRIAITLVEVEGGRWQMFKHCDAA